MLWLFLGYVVLAIVAPGVAFLVLIVFLISRVISAARH